jgi:hypothetical protein
MRPSICAYLFQKIHRGQKNDEFFMVAVHRHCGRDVACAAGIVAARLCVGPCTLGVNNQLAFARRSTGHAGHADVRPTVKLADYLVVA